MKKRTKKTSPAEPEPNLDPMITLGHALDSTDGYEERVVESREGMGFWMDEDGLEEFSDPSITIHITHEETFWLEMTTGWHNVPDFDYFSGAVMITNNRNHMTLGPKNWIMI